MMEIYVEGRTFVKVTISHPFYKRFDEHLKKSKMESSKKLCDT